MIKIEVTDTERSCQIKGDFTEICVETVLALRSMIENIEGVNPEAAKRFRKKLPDICTIAILSEDETDVLADFCIKFPEGGN